MFGDYFHWQEFYKSLMPFFQFNSLILLEDLRPVICRICGQSSGGSAASYLMELQASYLEDLRPVIWRICSRLSGGSAASYLVKCENKANSAQVELELGLSFEILIYISKFFGAEPHKLFFLMLDSIFSCGYVCASKM